MWVHHLNECLAKHALDDDVEPLVIEHHVINDGIDDGNDADDDDNINNAGDNGGDAIWHVRIEPPLATASIGQADDDISNNDISKVALHSDLTTATAIAQGELSAQKAFLEGTLRLEGDVSLLIAARETLEKLGVFGTT